jgi:hypothetical protein
MTVCKPRENRKTAVNRRTALLYAIGLVVGFVFGDGVVFEWMHLKVRDDRSEIDRIVAISRIRKELGDIQYDILELTENHLELMEHTRHSQNSMAGRKWRWQRSRLQLLINDFRSIESELAALEQRRPRDITLDFVPPLPPTGLSAKVVE